MEQILTAFYFEMNDDGTRTISDILQPAEGMTEKQFRRLANKHDPEIKPHFEYINAAPY